MCVLLQHQAKEGRRRAELANRTRAVRQPEVGDRRLYKDPKLSKAVAGHGPGRRPLRGPFVVKAAQGNRADLEDPVTGARLQSVHGDNLVGLPSLVDDTKV